MKRPLVRASQSQAGWPWIVAWFLMLSPCLADQVTLYLQNGDRITGTIVPQSTNAVQMTTSFGAVMTIPVNQIVRREILPVTLPVQPPASPAVSPKAEVTVAPTASPAAIAKPPPPPPPKLATPPPTAAKSGPTNATAAAIFRRFLREWRGNADLGLNLGFSTKDRQTYSGRFQAAQTHTLGNARALRNTLDYIVSYGQIEGVPADNRMDGNWKIENEIGRRFSLYNVVGAGYDEIRRINRQFDLGPGLGYRWITRTNFVLANELGANYQRQIYTGGITKQRYSLRVAEESWWQISSKLRLDQRMEFFPDVSQLSEFRARGEANLSYALRNNLSVKLTVIDLYETDAPPGVSHNDLQIRSSISVRF